MTTRRIGLALTAFCLVVIFVATLTPAANTTTSAFWCVACGELGGLDVLANILMFMPLGFALALALRRRWLGLAICVATTLFIESMQVRIVTGRDASLSDLLANSLGGAIGLVLGTHWRLVLHPRGTAAWRLAMGGATLFAAACTLAAAGLRPATIPRSLWVQWTPPRPGFEPFTGQVLSFELDSVDLPLGFPAPSFGVDRLLRGPEWTTRTRVATESITRTRSVLTRIAEEFTVLVSVEQLRNDLGCFQKTRSGDFRFRSPKVALREVFVIPNGSPPPIDTLTCGRSHGRLIAGAGSRREIVRLSPAIGWSLMWPFDVPLNAGNAWIGGLWLLVLMFPAGYWAGMAAADARRGQMAALCLTIVATVATGLGLAPWSAGVAVGVPWEFVSAVGGAVVGFGAAMVVRRMWPGPPDSAEG